MHGRVGSPGLVCCVTVTRGIVSGLGVDGPVRAHEIIQVQVMHVVGLGRDGDMTLRAELV